MRFKDVFMLNNYLTFLTLVTLPDFFHIEHNRLEQKPVKLKMSTDFLTHF